ncbi:hypothetical protein EB796_004915 [Bugula neritina]|uniref:Palmitoyltransferase n=1 Tax=Bugula neritina TaxID=10212 RepID=A0A7J7KDR2_BUGNE|nr:hypothetical protein EB796_004915 [Bugula neritina]
MACRGFRVKLNKFCNRNGPIVMNAVIPVWYVFSTVYSNWMAVDHMFDVIYGEGTRFAMVYKCLTVLLSAEMMINWIFLCRVRSDYQNSEVNNRKRLEHEKTFPQFVSEGVSYEELKEKLPTLRTGNWSVVTQYTGSDVKRTAYPYWGWKPCVVCSFYKPPRCHHCPLCEECVLKRDHHCFFARQCVGLNNQRFFVVFNFWAVMLNLLFIPPLLYYVSVEVWPNIAAPDLFLPYTLLSFILGWVSPYSFIVIFISYSLVYFFLLALTFLVEQIRCIDNGMTSYELENRSCAIKSQCKSRYERFACVFGRSQLWINLFIPYHWASEPTDDGITWQSMKKD